MPNGTEHLTSGDFAASDVQSLRKEVEQLKADLNARIKDAIGVQLPSQDQMLAERAAKYGPFDKHAITVEALWRVITNGYNAQALEDVHKEGLRMILHKIGRIVTGDPNYPDSWDDIGGYAKRVADHCRNIKPQSAQKSKQAIDPVTGEKFNPSGKIPLVSEGEKDETGAYT